MIVTWQGHQVRIRHDDPHLGPYTPRGAVIRSAIELVSDVEGLRLVLTSTVGDRYQVRVSDDGSVIGPRPSGRHAFDPGGSPLGRRERLGPVGGLAGDAAVGELEDEDHLVGVAANSRGSPWAGRRGCPPRAAGAARWSAAPGRRRRRPVGWLYRGWSRPTGAHTITESSVKTSFMTSTSPALRRAISRSTTTSIQDLTHLHSFARGTFGSYDSGAAYKAPGVVM